MVVEFWSSLTEELNAVGPPMKSSFKWKKVWVDQKRYVSTKAAANLKNQNETGGGPNLTKKLSAIEQSIYELVGMKELVEGLDGSLRFSEKKIISTQTVDIEEELLEGPTCSKAVTPPPLDATIDGEPIDKKASSHKRKRVEPQEKITTAELIAKELRSQENLCSKMTEIAESLRNSKEEDGAMMKRMYRALEKSAKEVEAKVEKAKKIFEIEELKLKIVMNKK